MNIIKEFKDMRGYEFLCRDLMAIKETENEIVSRICDHMERLCKTERYINIVLKEFEDDEYDVYLSLGQMSIMIQAINANNPLLGYEDSNDLSFTYAPDLSIYPELQEFHSEILDVCEDDRDNNSIDDILSYYLLASSIRNSNHRNISLVNNTTNYGDNWRYEDRYMLDLRYSRAIIAVNNMYKANIDKIKEIIRKKEN